MGSAISQLWPPAARFTEKALPDQSGKVFIITGACSGVGYHLASILYSANAKVYLLVRSESKASAAITSIKSQHPTSTGHLLFHHLDLSDLTLVAASAKSLLEKEDKIDVLWNNAGVMVPPAGSKTKQGYELQLGTNCLAPFLLTRLLMPLLLRTANRGNTEVRVVWVASSAAEAFSPKGGVDVKALEAAKETGESGGQWANYGTSKAGNIFYAKEMARRYTEETGIISIALNPGNLETSLQRHVTGFAALLINLTLYPPINGAYTELFAGLSPAVTREKSGAWIIPWGRFGSLRKDIESAGLPTAEGGTGGAEQFWEWSEEQVEEFL